MPRLGRVPSRLGFKNARRAIFPDRDGPLVRGLPTASGSPRPLLTFSPFRGPSGEFLADNLRLDELIISEQSEGTMEGIIMSGSARWRFGAIIGTGVLLAAAAATPAPAQTYPSGPVRVVVPYGAGGATDVLARVFADYLQRHLGQSFTIENRAGGAGQIGATAVARAPADGYTLFFTPTAPITIAPLMTGKEPRTGFRAVAIVAVQPAWLVANAASPFKTFGDVVKHAKDNPGKLTFGSPGVRKRIASRGRSGDPLGGTRVGACAVPQRRRRWSRRCWAGRSTSRRSPPPRSPAR